MTTATQAPADPRAFSEGDIVVFTYAFVGLYTHDDGRQDEYHVPLGSHGEIGAIQMIHGAQGRQISVAPMLSDGSFIDTLQLDQADLEYIENGNRYPFRLADKGEVATVFPFLVKAAPT